MKCVFGSQIGEHGEAISLTHISAWLDKRGSSTGARFRKGDGSEVMRGPCRNLIGAVFTSPNFLPSVSPPEPHLWSLMPPVSQKIIQTCCKVLLCVVLPPSCCSFLPYLAGGEKKSFSCYMSSALSRILIWLPLGQDKAITHPVWMLMAEFSLEWNHRGSTLSNVPNYPLSFNNLPSRVKCKFNDIFNGLCKSLTSVSLYFLSVPLPQLVLHTVVVLHTVGGVVLGADLWEVITVMKTIIKVNNDIRYTHLERQFTL